MWNFLCAFHPHDFYCLIKGSFFVFIQAILFAVDEFSVVTFNTDNIETFRNIFIMDYEKGQPSHDLYTKDHVYQHMFFAWKKVSEFIFVRTFMLF